MGTVKKLQLLPFSVYIFSVFLAFGKYNPVSFLEIVKDLLTVLLIGVVFFTTDVLRDIPSYKTSLFQLFGVGIIIFLCDLFYGYSPYYDDLFLLKYFAAIIIFWFLSYVFKQNPDICYNSILIFSLVSSAIALLYVFGFLNEQFEFRGDRLYIFGENPNSISTRMSIAFIVILYYIVQNPMDYGKWRYLLLLTFPALFIFIVDTGSRGSFLAVILGAFLILFLSSLKKEVKVALLIVGAMILVYAIGTISESNLYLRLTQSNLLDSRGVLWDYALNIFYDNPFGVGQGGYVREMQMRYNETHDTHNLFIYLLVAGGFASFIIFMFFIKDLFLKAFAGLRGGNALIISIFIFILFIAAKTGGVITYLIMWYFLAVVNSITKKQNTDLV